MELGKWGGGEPKAHDGNVGQLRDYGKEQKEGANTSKGKREARNTVDTKQSSPLRSKTLGDGEFHLKLPTVIMLSAYQLFSSVLEVLQPLSTGRQPRRNRARPIQFQMWKRYGCTLLQHCRDGRFNCGG